MDGRLSDRIGSVRMRTESLQSAEKEILRRCWALHPDVVCCRVGTTAVALSLERGIYISLDELATRIWDELSDGRTPADIASSIANDYQDAEFARIQSDVLVALADFRTKQLIVPAKGGDTRSTITPSPPVIVRPAQLGAVPSVWTCLTTLTFFHWTIRTKGLRKALALVPLAAPHDEFEDASRCRF
jgi:hypothetical protein